MGATQMRRTKDVVFDVDEAKYRTITHAQFVYILCTLLLAMVTCGLQAEIMGDAAPTIARKFNAELKLSWMASSGYLTQVCSLLIFGKLYDVLEPKRLVLLSCTCFAAGSIISATSRTFGILVGGLALAGLGRSGITVGSIVILGIICPERPRRAVLVSYVTGAYGLMLKMAPIVSGLLLRDQGSERWRWVFWICVPFQVTLIILVSAFPILRRRRPSWQQCRSLDFFGAALQALAIAVFVLPFLIGSTKGQYAWRSPTLLAMYILAPFVFTAFIFWEKRKDEAKRFIPLTAIRKHRSIILLALVTISSSLIVAATTFFLPPYLQIVRNSSPLLSALQMLPSILIGSLGSLGVGKLLARPVPRMAQYICIIGSLCQLVGGVIFWFLHRGGTMTGFYLTALVMGFGAGSLFGIGITLVLEILPESAYGQAAAFMTSAAALGSVIGIALQGIIVQTISERFVATYVDFDVFKALTSTRRDLVDGLFQDDMWAQFQDMYFNTQRQACLMFAAFGCLSLLASLALKPHVRKAVGVEVDEKVEAALHDEESGETKPATDLSFGRLSEDLRSQLKDMAVPAPIHIGPRQLLVAAVVSTKEMPAKVLETPVTAQRQNIVASTMGTPPRVIVTPPKPAVKEVMPEGLISTETTASKQLDPVVGNKSDGSLEILLMLDECAVDALTGKDHKDT